MQQPIPNVRNLRGGFLERIESYSHLLFSGFHILSEQYPDGSICEDVVRPVGEYLQQVRSAMSGLKIHLEMASIGSKRVRESVLQHVIPHVHSLGLNETELPLLLENFGEEKRAQQLREEPCIVDFLEAVSLAQEKTNLERIHFHNLGYYLCMEREPWRDSTSMRDALLFGRRHGRRAGGERPVSIHGEYRQWIENACRKGRF